GGPAGDDRSGRGPGSDRSVEGGAAARAARARVDVGEEAHRLRLPRALRHGPGGDRRGDGHAVQHGALAPSPRAHGVHAEHARADGRGGVMTRHDESLLWEYAARELEPEEARLVQHHLGECPECQEKLSDVRLAQGALNAARTAPVSLSYGRVDATLSKVIDRKLQSQAFGRRWVLGLSGALVAAGAALVVFGLWPKLTFTPAPAPVAPVEAAVEAPRVVPVIENAEALTRVGVTSEVMQKGGALESGDVLKTALHGKATLKLPEGTRVAMTGNTQLALTRAQKDEIALSLERGHVAVAASHARERKGFVLHTNGLMVTVVGTVFSVTSSRDMVEVAVSEGRVSVEAP